MEDWFMGHLLLSSLFTGVGVELVRVAELAPGHLETLTLVRELLPCLGLVCLSVPVFQCCMFLCVCVGGGGLRARAPASVKVFLCVSWAFCVSLCDPSRW